MQAQSTWGRLTAPPPEIWKQSNDGRRALLDRADDRNHVDVPETQSLGLTIKGVADVEER